MRWLLILLAMLVLAGCTKAGEKATTSTEKVLTREEVSGLAESYIAKYFAPEGEEVRVTSVWEEHGVYGFNVTVMGMNYTSYITKDGKIIFPTGFYTDRAPSIPPPEDVAPQKEGQG